MKIYEKEISANGKKRLLIALGRQELELLYGIVKKAYLHTPDIAETARTITRLHTMKISMGKFIREMYTKEIINDTKFD